MACLFPLLKVFQRADVLSFSEGQFIFFFFLLHCAFGVLPKKSLPNSASQIYYSVFFSRRFIVLDFTFDL